jgi:hypothetical protein
MKKCKLKLRWCFQMIHGNKLLHFINNILIWLTLPTPLTLNRLLSPSGPHLGQFSLKPAIELQDKNTVMTCFHCDTFFSIIIRKHHCQGCGKVFCCKCSRVVNQSKEERESITDFNNLNNKKRLCKQCEKKHSAVPSRHIFHSSELSPSPRTFLPLTFQHLENIEKMARNNNGSRQFGELVILN